MKITVFTPTYNRSYIIENLYQSLKRQSFTDFEWLVIDDGSTDDTQSLFSVWETEENAFPVRYYKQENGGKCRAINRALDLARGELFFTVDSDDYLTDDALEKIARWFADIDPAGPVQGVVANKGYSANRTGNNLFDEDFLDKSLLDIYSYQVNGKKMFNGERALIFFTEFHKRYKYPEFSGENFMTEAVAWNRMAHDGYLMRFYNDIIWVYEYKEDGLTKAGSSVFLNNPKGYGLWLREKAEFEGISLKDRLKMYYTFTCDLSERLSNQEIAQCIGTNRLLIEACNAVHRLKRRIRK